MKTETCIVRTERRTPSDMIDKKTVIVMIGLPARGKSYIVNMLHRYLNWVGYKTKVFNAGDYRRKLGFSGESAEFFDPNNQASKSLRNKFALLAFDDLLSFLLSTGDVGIFDATNTTRERRKQISDKCWNADINVLFLESICNDPVLLNKNYSMKLSNSDYKNMNHDEALQDFKERLKQYEKVYETLDEEYDKDSSYIKLYNVGQYLTANHCNGVLESDVIFYLLNTHIQPRKIWLCIHGETDSDVEGILGGDPDLNANGEHFSNELHSFIQKQNNENISILCDTAHSVYQTVKPLLLEYNVNYCSLLKELDGGDYKETTYAYIKENHPIEFERRQKNKLKYRYPGGESYLDVKERCHRVLMKLIGNRDSILVVAHKAVIRVIMSYFMDIPCEEMPFLKVNMHTVYELEPTAYCTKSTEYKLM